MQAARAALAEAEARWRAADTAQLRARQRVDEGLALAERRAAELTQLDEEAAALARDLAELERERLELVAAGEPGDEAATAAAEEAAARIALGEAERRLAAAEAEVGRAEAAWLATQRDVRVLGEAAQRSTVELEQARLVAGADARAAAEQEAERRARAGALERELAELGDALAAADPAAAAAGALARERETEQMAAEAALATAEAARRQAAEALTTARGEAAALARRLEGIERSRAGGRCSARRGGGRAGRAAAAAAAPGGRGRRWRRRARDPIRRGWRSSRPGWLEEEAAAEAARDELARREAVAQGLEAELAAADAALAGLRERLAVAQSERGHAHEALAATVAAVRDRLQQEPLSHAGGRGDPGRGGGGQHRGARCPARAAAGVARPAGAGQSARRGRGRRARGHRGRDPGARGRAAAGAGPAAGRDRHARRRGARSVCWPRSRRSTGISAGCSPCCSAAARRICASTGADDPLQAGLELEASPPGKKLSSISLLSGGEKTLTALALVFAFFLAQPSPLCVLDEVDAPLDDANVDRFVALMQEIAQATGTRFLVVTHHPLTMARMDRLYGVTMAERGHLAAGVGGARAGAGAARYGIVPQKMWPP